MKKLFSCIAFGLISIQAFGAIDLAPASGSLVLTSNDDSGLSLVSELAGIEHTTVNTQSGLFTLLQVPDYSYTHQIGAPQLPVKREIIAVPLEAVVTATVTESWYEQFNLADWNISHPVIPAQPSLSKSQSPEDVPFEYNSDAYTRVGFERQPLVQLEELGILRGQRLFVIELAPVQYSPTTGQLRVYSHLEVEIAYSGADLESTDNLRARTWSPYFESLYRSQLLNYRPLNQRDDLTRYPIKYVIVSDPLFEAQLAPFIEWKTQQGYDVITGYLGDPDVGYTTTSIAAYIQSIWDAATPEDPAPSFVLFVGDDSEVPAFSGSQGGHITDLNYVRLEGSDFMPEIYYGRFSAQTPAQLQPQIDKTLEYERYLMPDPSYLEEVVMIAGMDGSFGSVWANGQINYGTTYYFNALHGITSHTYLYPNSGGNAANIIADVSNGVGYVNYTAHGSQTSWADPSFTISNINSLQNDHEYPTVVGNCCLTNAFNTGTCFGEAWLRAENKGAIGYIGGTNNTYWDEDYWWGVGSGSIVVNPTYETHGLGAYDGMFHDHGEDFIDWHTTQYSVIMAGNLAVIEGGSGLVNYYWEIYALMGDPSLTTFFGVPAVNSVSYPESIFLGQTAMTIQAEAYSYVGLSMDGNLVAGGLVGSSGSLTLEFEPIANPGVADLVITRQNHQPVMGTVEVIPNEGPYVVLDGCVIEDDNGQLNPGESPHLTIGIHNVGVEIATGVNVSVTTADAWVTMLDDNEYYGDMDPDETITITDGFQVAVSPDTPENHLVHFELEATDNGSGVWNSGFDLPVLFIYELYWSNNCEAIGDWTHSAADGWSDQWHLSSEQYQSPTHSWKCGDTGTGNYANSLDARLVSPAVTLRPNSTLSFQHQLAGEVSGVYPDSAYDGGILEISDDGGFSWLQLTPVSGGYTSAFRWESGGGSPATHPFAGGTPCWSGEFDWQETLVSLADYAEETVQFRFRFGSDQGGGAEGWYIDDLSISGLALGELPPVTDLTIQISGGYVVLSWSAIEGAVSYNVYGADTPYGEYLLLGNTGITQWTLPLSGGAGFYQVTALN